MKESQIEAKRWFRQAQADMALEAAEQVLEVVRTFLSAHTDILKEEE